MRGGAPMSTARLDSLLAAIEREPWRFDFFQALRRIDAQQPERPRLGSARRPQDEPIRLGQAPDLSFAPAALHALRRSAAGPAPRIEVRFFGLFGPNGPLPLHLTEYARERLLHHHDETLARFADLFHHRLLLLFYRAWAQAQATTSLDRPAEDRFADFVGSLIGIGTPALQHRDAVADHAKLHSSGWLVRQVRSAEGLESLLSDWLRRPVQVRPFAGAWMGLQPSERTTLGRRRAGRRNLTARLGRGAVLGATVWDRQHHFSIAVGPLDHPAFEALLPGGGALPGLVALVEQYVGDEFGWTLELGLRREQIRPARPGRHGRLGWDSWLGRRGASTPSAAAQLDVAARPPAAEGAVATLRLAPLDALRALIRRQRAPANPQPHT